MSSTGHRKNWNTPGHAHELTFSCYRGYPMLARDRTRRWLIEAIAQARKEHDLALLAYVIMPEHVHLLIRPRQSAYDMADTRACGVRREDGAAVGPVYMPITTCHLSKLI